MQRYRILKYPWHTPLDYEMSKLPHDLYFLNNSTRRWATEYRPIPKNISWVGSVSAVDTDVLILSIDQWTFDTPSKRSLFEFMKRSYSGPKIVLNLGSNMVDGCTPEELRSLVDGCLMVCVSSSTTKQWGYPRTHYILHGFSPEEWPQTNYERNEILVTQPSRDFQRRYRNLDGILQAQQKVPLTWIGRDQNFHSFGEYRNYLAGSSIYFNCAHASCNPLARSEAMLCGLAVVTTCCHGEEEYIRNGENGFCSNDLEELIDYLVYLREHPEVTQRIGRAGRETASKVFHIDRYIEEWNNALRDSIN